MSIFVIGGTGFIGSRLTRSLVGRGEKITCFDINTDAADFSDLGDSVSVVRGDLTQFDDVMSCMADAEPERVINLSYFLHSLLVMYTLEHSFWLIRNTVNGLRKL